MRPQPTPTVMPAFISLPNPENYTSPGALIALKVTNEGPVTADFDGVLMGE